MTPLRLPSSRLGRLNFDLYLIIGMGIPLECRFAGASINSPHRAVVARHVLALIWMIRYG